MTTFLKRLTVDLRPGQTAPVVQERDHQELADGLLDLVMQNLIHPKVARSLLEFYRERLPGQGFLDKAILQQVRLAYGIDLLSVQHKCGSMEESQ